MKFKHSSSSASSILERQILKLREEHKNLINLLSSFVETANINEDLFNKSKSLTLKILESNSKQEIIKVVEDAFKKDFKVNKPILKFYKNERIDELEKVTLLVDEATTKKEKIEATIELRKAKARLQAVA